MLGLLWTVWCAWAEPPAVPVQVPRVPSVPLDGVPRLPATGWTRAEVGGVPVSLTLGRTVVQLDLRGRELPRCDCTHDALTCAVRDDGSVDLRLTHPTEVRTDPDLGRCSVQGPAFAVVAVPAPPPDPWEVGPGDWIVPVAPGAEAPRDLLAVRKPRRWRAPDGAICALRLLDRRHAVVDVVGTSTGDGFAPCLTRKTGEEIRVRTVTFVAAW